MLHQDFRPDNIMIDKTGTVKIIDFGSTKVAGVIEATPSTDHQPHFGHRPIHRAGIFPGRKRLVALRYILSRSHYLSDADGKAALWRSDGERRRTKSQQRKLKYSSALDDNREIPAWIDGALKKAVHPDPYKRYEELSEFIFDLRHPNDEFLKSSSAPLLERNPLLFWKCLSSYSGMCDVCCCSLSCGDNYSTLLTNIAASRRPTFGQDTTEHEVVADCLDRAPDRISSRYQRPSAVSPNSTAPTRRPSLMTSFL